MEDLEETIRTNCNICLEIKEIHQRIIIDKKRLQHLEMFYKLKIKEQKKLVKKIFLLEGKIEILPSKGYKEQENKKFETFCDKGTVKEQEKMLKRLLALRAERQQKKQETHRN